MKFLSNFLADESGVTAVECVLIVAIVGVAFIGALDAWGYSVLSLLN